MKNYISPSKRMYNSVFNELIEYVENDCAEKELTLNNNNYSWWDKFVYDFFPKKYSKSLRKKLGVNYINNILSIDSEEYFYVKEGYSRIKELYFWYINEYLFIKNPWEKEFLKDKYITNTGVSTNLLFSDNILNKIHPEYLVYLENNLLAEKQQLDLFENKLQELLKIRFVL